MAASFLIGRAALAARMTAAVKSSGIFVDYLFLRALTVVQSRGRAVLVGKAALTATLTAALQSRSSVVGRAALAGRTFVAMTSQSSRNIATIFLRGMLTARAALRAGQMVGIAGLIGRLTAIWQSIAGLFVNRPSAPKGIAVVSDRATYIAMASDRVTDAPVIADSAAKLATVGDAPGSKAIPGDAVGGEAEVSDA